MPQEQTINLKPALSGFPVVMAFNRYAVTKASPYYVATCGLASDDGELLSSYSFAINPEMSPDNTESIIKYLTRTKKPPKAPEFINRGIRLPKGGVTIPHAALLNAGRSGEHAEIRLENFSASAIPIFAQNSPEAEAQEYQCDGVALLRSTFSCHYHLLAEIYIND